MTNKIEQFITVIGKGSSHNLGIIFKTSVCGDIRIKKKILVLQKPVIELIFARFTYQYCPDHCVCDSELRFITIENPMNLNKDKCFSLANGDRCGITWSISLYICAEHFGKTSTSLIPWITSFSQEIIILCNSIPI